MSGVPLREHALLSDCRSSALVTAAGSVDWLCLPRFDSPAVLMLSSDVAMHVDRATASAVVTLEAGESRTFALQQGDAWGAEPSPWKARSVRRRLAATEASWRSWSGLHQRYDRPWRELVHHSGVVLRGLTYARSGAVVAAPTTSLPEGVGSGRTGTTATRGSATRA